MQFYHLYNNRYVLDLNTMTHLKLIKEVEAKDVDMITEMLSSNRLTDEFVIEFLKRTGYLYPNTAIKGSWNSNSDRSFATKEFFAYQAQLHHNLIDGPIKCELDQFANDVEQVMSEMGILHKNNAKRSSRMPERINMYYPNLSETTICFNFRMKRGVDSIQQLQEMVNNETSPMMKNAEFKIWIKGAEVWAYCTFIHDLNEYGVIRLPAKKVQAPPTYYRVNTSSLFLAQP